MVSVLEKLVASLDKRRWRQTVPVVVHGKPLLRYFKNVSHPTRRQVKTFSNGSGNGRAREPRTAKRTATNHFHGFWGCRASLTMLPPFQHRIGWNCVHLSAKRQSDNLVLFASAPRRPRNPSSPREQLCCLVPQLLSSS